MFRDSDQSLSCVGIEGKIVVRSSGKLYVLAKNRFD